MTTELVVRSAPGTGADSTVYSPWLDAPLKVYVVDGPVSADGYTWYLVTSVLEPSLDATPSGWVAAAGTDGETWLAPHTVACPEAPSMDDLLALQPLVRLGCFAGQELTLEGVLSGCAAAEGGPWESGCYVFSPGFDGEAMPPGCVDVCIQPRLLVHFPNLPQRDQGPIRFSGHFDDPAAQRCPSDPASDLPQLDVLRCRTAFVATSMSMTGAP